MLGAAGIVGAIAALGGIIPVAWIHAGRNFARRLAAKRMVPVYLGMVVLACRALLLPLFPAPTPVVADEFSYLLLGQTLASARLAYPAHQLWQHFETLFVLNQPVYASVYPLAQGLTLALGIVMGGKAWWGVWLSAGLMSAAICWMLRAWMPPTWALLGGCLAAIQLGIFSYWMNSYWGGCPAAVGGALVFGALPRMERQRRVGDAVLFGAGLAILANSRPYEGFVVAAVAVAWLCRSWLRLSGSERAGAMKVHALPLMALLVVTAGADGYYFRRITGSPIRMPYQAYIEQYAAAPAFVWQGDRAAPVYRHDVLRDAHQSFRTEYQQYKSAGGFLRMSLMKLGRLASFYLGPLWLVPLVLLPQLMRRKRIRILLIAAGAGLGAILLAVPFWPHYAAPMAGIIFAIASESLRMLWAMQRRGVNIGRYLVPAAPVVCLFGSLFPLRATHFQSRLAQRPAVVQRLEQAGSSHLVFVHYGAHHALGEEWVYNQPDIDSARIVWARDMGAVGNEELRRYFPERASWLLNPDDNPPLLATYPSVYGTSEFPRN